MNLVHIIARSASVDDISIVDRALRKAGLQTAIIRLDDNEDANAEALTAMVEGDHGDQRNVWLMPAMAVELMAIDEDRKAPVREIMGRGPAEFSTRRLIFTTDRRTSDTIPGSVVMHLDDVISDDFCVSSLRALFD